MGGVDAAGVVLGMSAETFRVKLEWLDTLTGQRGTYVEKPCGFGSVWKDDDGDLSLFQWQEGNYSCDCNRGAFFTDAVEDCGNSRFRILDGWITPEATSVGEEVWTHVPVFKEAE
jgi:hypothetical protein